MSSADLRLLADELDATGTEAFMTWDGGFPVYAPILDRWCAAMSERGYDRASQFYDRLLAREAPPLSQETIATADTESLRGYAILIFRGERFCDGHIGGCHSQGLLAALARRFAEIEA